MWQNAVTDRRFSAPWSAEVTPNCFIVGDADGQALSYIFLPRIAGIIIVDRPTGFNHE
jgi:hypothetical protein